MTCKPIHWKKKQNTKNQWKESATTNSNICKESKQKKREKKKKQKRNEETIRIIT